MSWSYRIARFAGTDIRIHATFLLLLAWIGVSYYLDGGWNAALLGVGFILALFLCVLLHEFGHVLAARTYGIRTPDITLLPIGGLARLERMPERPIEELVVALAGPAVNLVIALVLAVVLGQHASLTHVESLAHPQVGFLAKLASVNISLVLFNLIPAFPMDGGRVLRALLALRLGPAQATHIAARVGQGLALLFGFAGLFFNPLLIFVAFFVFLGAQQEATQAQMKDLSGQLRVADAMITQLTSLPASATLNDAVEALLRTSQHEFPVVDAEGRALGVLTRDAMIAALKHRGPEAPVVAFMHRGPPTVSLHAPFAEAFEKMHTCGCPAIPVVDAEGRLVGLITPENVGELMLVRSLRRPPKLPPWRAPQPQANA